MTAVRRIKLRLPSPAPRNPLVVPALQRRAGTHRKSRKAERAAQKAALRTELTRGGRGD